MPYKDHSPEVIETIDQLPEMIDIYNRTKRRFLIDPRYTSLSN